MWYRGLAVAAIAILVLVSGPWLSVTAAPAAGAGKADIVRPGEDPDDGVQGDYLSVNQKEPAGEAKIIGQGGNAYRMVFTPYGAANVDMSGKVENGQGTLTGPDGASAVLAGKTLTVTVGGKKYKLVYTHPQSTTQGLKPPAGAIVLLAYAPPTPPSLAEWANNSWEALADGSMVKGGGDIRTKRSLGDMQLHLEFRCPYMASARGQGRGNSGVYLMDRYEVQILDSFGNPSKDDECGGIYKVATPKVNASFPPDVWQTYDIIFRAPRFDAQGKKVKNAAVTVVQNGLTIHENVEIPGPTGGAVGGPEVREAPLRLQDHGNPVRFRNIWALPLKAGQVPPALKIPAAGK